MRPFSVVLLAAGGSRRLGSPKQLVEYEGTPLLLRAIRTALDSGALEVIVVLGSEASFIRQRIESIQILDERVKFLENEDWTEGMGGSIRVGVQGVSATSLAIVLMVCDQPHLRSTVLKALVGALSDAVLIAACSYGGRPGSPCCFDRALASELLQLTGDQGARDLIRDPHRNVALVPFDDGSFDIDTPEDLIRLTR